MGRGDIAAAIHKRMVDDNRFGYSWEERYGAIPETWTVGGVKFVINVGDYDCSSSTITAWKKALTGSAYEHALDGATYTGNMKNVFTASGLFEWKPMSFLAAPGDLYLNEGSHVAMCQTQVPDILSEFSWGDKGAYGNKRGDQSGREAHTGNYYNYPWNGILHYTGKADGAATPANPVVTTAASPAKAPTVKFRVKQAGSWKQEGYAGTKNIPITAIAIDFNGWYQVCTASHGWLDVVRGYDIKDEENGYAGWEDSPIVAVRAYYETPNPSKTGYYCAKYRVSDLGASWWPYQIDDDVSAIMDGYAGDMRPIDRFEISLVKA